MNYITSACTATSLQVLLILSVPVRKASQALFIETTASIRFKGQWYFVGLTVKATSIEHFSSSTLKIPEINLMYAKEKLQDFTSLVPVGSFVNKLLIGILNLEPFIASKTVLPPRFLYCLNFPQPEIFGCLIGCKTNLCRVWD